MAVITTAGQFGATVRAARREAGLTQVGLAEQAGVSRAWLARFEAGHPSASLEQILLVLRTLDRGIEVVRPQLSPKDQAIVDAVHRQRGGRR